MTYRSLFCCLFVLLTATVAAGSEIGANDFRISEVGAPGNTSHFALHPQVAYNSVEHEFLAVWWATDYANGLLGDFEVWTQRIDAVTGQQIGPDRQISETPIGEMGFFFVLGASHPAVAYDSTDNEYLVVWLQVAASAPEIEIFGQRIDGANGLEIGADDFRISDMNNGGDLGALGVPSVAYNRDAGEYLVVWRGVESEEAGFVQGESEIFGQRIDADTGQEVGTNDFRISDMGGTGNADYGTGFPDVVYNPTSKEYLVVWSGDDNVGGLVDDETEIFGQRLVGATGAEVGPNDFRISFTVGTGGADFDAHLPSVAVDPIRNEYLVAYQASLPPPIVVDTEEVFTQRLGPTGARLAPFDHRVSSVAGIGLPEAFELSPDVVFNAVEKEYLVVWYSDDDGSGLVDGEEEIFVQRLDAATGLEIGVDDRRISDMGGVGNGAFDGLAASVAYDSTANQYLVVWHGDDNVGGLVDDETEIFGQRLLARAWAAPAPPMAIPDGLYDGSSNSMACSSLEVTDQRRRPLDVRVRAAIDHSFIGDLTVRLEGPDGTVTTLLSRPGLEEPADDGSGCCGSEADLWQAAPITWSDDAPRDAETMGDGLGSVDIVCETDGSCFYLPNGGAAGTTALSDHLGAPVSGEWTLCVGDSAGGDLGTLHSWELLPTLEIPGLFRDGFEDGLGAWSVVVDG